MNEEGEKASLIDLTIEHFSKIGYKVERDVTLEGLPSLTRKCDLLIRRGDERRLVFVKDWRRSVGVNTIINVDRAAEALKIPGPIIVSNEFSEHARAYAKRRGVTLLTKQEVLRKLR